MKPKALFLLRDTSGMQALAQQLADRFGYEICAGFEAADLLQASSVPHRSLTAAEALDMIADATAEVRLLLANYHAVELAGRGVLSWKKALMGFDRAIVDCVRAAAWSCERMAVLGDPNRYAELVQELERNGGKVSQRFRTESATNALRAASTFDFAVAQYLETQAAEAPDLDALAGYPKAIQISRPRALTFSQGANAHQKAALYGNFQESYRRVSGPQLDFEAILNVSRGTYLIGEFERATTAVVSRGRIRKVATGGTIEDCWSEMEGDDCQVSGWLLANGSLGADLLSRIARSGLSGIVLPSVTEEEEAVLTEYPGLSVLVAKEGLGYEALQEVRDVAGGLLLQDKDRFGINPMEWQTLGLVQPLVEDWEPLLFGAKVARHLDSSAILCLKGMSLFGFEAFGDSPVAAWNAISDGDDDFSDTLWVFDEALNHPEILKEMKTRGARTVLLPSGTANDALRDVANEAGLCVMVMPKSLMKL